MCPMYVYAKALELPKLIPLEAAAIPAAASGPDRTELLEQAKKCGYPEVEKDLSPSGVLPTGLKVVQKQIKKLDLFMKTLPPSTAAPGSTESLSLNDKPLARKLMRS